MLTQTLRVLERDGFVRRIPTASIPPRVDYELTDRGFDFVPLIQPLMQWALETRKDIEQSQADYDTEDASSAA